MDWEFIVALVIAIPLILLPVAFIWYLNLAGAISAVRGFWHKRTLRHRGPAAKATCRPEELPRDKGI